MDIRLSALRYDATLEKTNLVSLENIFYDSNVLKSKAVSLSDWGRDVLTETQVHYAVYDAIMGRHVYDYFRDRGESNRCLKWSLEWYDYL